MPGNGELTFKGGARRRALKLLGGAALAAGTAGRPAPAAELKGVPPRSCVLTPEQAEGPFFVDTRLNRSDIRSDPLDGLRREGVPLALELRVLAMEQGQCPPIAEAMLDIWQCDAAGVYSNVRDARHDTARLRFLRGYQLTDPDGRARFTTIYPGWYPGRAVHIHFKLRVKGPNRAYALTSQFYFDDELTDRIHTQPPYAARGTKRVRNEEDGIYRRGGKQLMLPVTETPDGLAARYDIALRLG